MIFIRTLMQAVMKKMSLKMPASIFHIYFKSTICKERGRQAEHTALSIRGQEQLVIRFGPKAVNFRKHQLHLVKAFQLFPQHRFSLQQKMIVIYAFLVQDCENVMDSLLDFNAYSKFESWI